ncbi:MAG TPA: PLP-dependent aminotransferase family protein [Blastocatellia bacterium]|nr:PLP-dependent aminotransferase family protein [Blastocatellia bacterium]
MPKRATSFSLILPERDAATPAYRWLYDALRAAILDGRMRPGSRLPATRDLAAEYGLSRGTIISAFEQLKSEGYVEGSVGSGTYVSKVLPDELFRVKGKAGPKQPERQRKGRVLSDYARQAKLFPNYGVRPVRAFRANLPALDLFPIALWTQLATRRLRQVTRNLLMGCESMGYDPLRAAIADYLNTSRGVKCAPDQVVVVSGVQEALDLAARLFLNPGDRVCVEEPGYTGAAMVFEAYGAKIRPAPLDQEGLEVTERTLRGSRLVYVTPGHQFPLGMTMSLSRRLALLDWARTSGAMIFEDDYDSEYRYSGRPVPALQGLDPEGPVLFAGSFSKVLFPSLRLGYLVVPRDMIDIFAAAKSIMNRHGPLLEQTVLCDFIVEGHFGRHLRRMREIYAERLSFLLTSARQRLAGLLEISEIEAGLQTTGWLGDGIQGVAAEEAAAARGVEVVALSRYSRGPLNREGLMLGFAAMDTAEIQRGVEQLGVALEQQSRI